jgi:hypothetical protein
MEAISFSETVVTAYTTSYMESYVSERNTAQTEINLPESRFKQNALSTEFKALALHRGSSDS